MKEKVPDLSKPQYISYDSVQRIKEKLDGKFSEVEITGGGDPTLHQNIEDIISLFDKEYTKMYTNGFLMKPVYGLNEINISRVHWDSKVNNRWYSSNSQNDLQETLDYYKPIVGKIRMQTILLKGAIECEEKALGFIQRYEDVVDQFIFRTLFPKCDLDKEFHVSYFSIDHPKAILDQTLDNYDRDLFFVGTDGVIHTDFQF